MNKDRMVYGSMIAYIALLRGINVGGKNKVKMEALKQMFVRLRLCQVQTYIQSGNVVFKSTEAEEALQRKIEDEFKQLFGFSVVVILRTAEEIRTLIANCPFAKKDIGEAAPTAEHLYAAFLLKAPAGDDIEKLSVYRQEKEEFHISGRDICLLLPHSIRDSKLANNLQRLDVPMTVRKLENNQ